MLLTLGHLIRRYATVLIVAVCFCGVNSTSWAKQNGDQGWVCDSDTTQQLQSAVRRLNIGLAKNSHAEGWRRYLLLNILETQAAKGEQADIGTLQKIHQRFNSGADGLNHPVFSDVRNTLECQIKNLYSAQIGDLSYAVVNAASQFRPITIDTMRYHRDRAKTELIDLKSYYRQERSSRDRAEAFYQLQLDELTDYLDQITFELAPEVSVGKIDSMVRSVREQLREVVKEIDALPFVDEDDENPDQQEPDQNPTQDSPTPDDETSLGDLEKQQEKLEKRVEELQEQRREIRKLDLPRARARAATRRKLREFDNRFEQAAKTYGDPYFVSARLAFIRFSRAYTYGTADNLQEDFLLRIERLAEELPKLQFAEERVAAGTVGNTLAWLENAFQVPHLVSAIRARYSNPNVYVNISSQLLNQIGSQTVRDTRPLNENIDGRLVRGQVNSVAHVTLDLQDDPNQVHVSVRLQADVNSNTYLRQGKIYAYVDSSGQAECRRSIFANVGGLFAGEPSVAASASTCFNGTSSNCGLVERIALKQFAEQKPKADATAGNRIRNELLEQFSSQTEQPLAEGKKTLRDAQKKARDKSNLLPEIYAQSQSDKIILVGKKSSKSTLAAPDYPANIPFYSELQVRVNDSILSNFIDPIFSGKKFTDKELAAELETLLGSKPGALTPQAANKQADDNGVQLNPPGRDAGDGAQDDESFSITFTTVRPVQFEFENNGFAVVVSGRSFSQADNEIKAGLKIVLRFKIKQVGGKLKLVRDGKAEIDYVDPDNKTPKVVAFRSFLDGRLNPKDAAKQVDVELPDNLLPVDQIEALKDGPIANGLTLNQCRLEGGWFYLGWNYVPKGQYYSGPIDLPAVWNEATIDEMEPAYTPVGELAPTGSSPLR
jgi:hypothetical protein